LASRILAALSPQRLLFGLGRKLRFVLNITATAAGHIPFGGSESENTENTG
jgi:hypothetical protein